jgi:hypothetical protein
MKKASSACLRFQKEDDARVAILCRFKRKLVTLDKCGTTSHYVCSL